jgi:hypothetical protein
MWLLQLKEDGNAEQLCSMMGFSLRPVEPPHPPKATNGAT